MKKFQYLLLITIIFIPNIAILPANYFTTTNSIPLTQEEENRDSWFWLPRTLISSESTKNAAGLKIDIDQMGNIHLIWLDMTPLVFSDDDADLFYRMWNATTHSWTFLELISTESTVPNLISDIDIKVDKQGNRHVVWCEDGDYLESGTDRDVYYKVFDNTLEYWKYYELLSEESNSSSYSVAIEVDDQSNLHVVWRDSLNISGEGTEGDIYYKQKNFISGDWTETEVVSGESNMSSTYPDMAVDSSGIVHVVWTDATDFDGDGETDIFYTSKNETGWAPNTIISTESTNLTQCPSIVCDMHNNIHVAWEDLTDYNSADGDFDIFYKYFDFNLQSWQNTAVVSTESTDNSIGVSITYDDEGNIHFVWSDKTNYHYSGSQFFDVFYKYYDLNSDYWPYTELLSTDSTMNAGGPEIASYENVLHVFWSDNTPFPESDYYIDIYYRKYTGPPTTPTLPPILSEHVSGREIFLDWGNCSRTSSYYLYRSSEYFTSIDDLEPVVQVNSSNYLDTVPEDGAYYYAVVSGNYELNSSMSNIVYVTIIKNQLNFGLKGLIFLCVGFGLVQILTFAGLSIIYRRKTKKLVELYAVKSSTQSSKDLAKTDEKKEIPK